MHGGVKRKTLHYTTPNGQTLTLYPIAYLANSVNRSISCLDAWVRRGVLPQTPFRHGRYKCCSQEQIDVIAKTARDFNIRSAVTIPHDFSVALKHHLDNLFSYYGLVETCQPIEVEARTPTYRETQKGLRPIHYKLPTGEVVDLFSVGVLAQKLGREPQVIKKWEMSGALPKTPFKTKSRFRLYTQDQIDLIVKYAEVFNVRNGVSIKASGFTNAVKNGYISLFASYGLKVLS
jgi:DNA-binding transcriptional MerR regulator